MDDQIIDSRVMTGCLGKTRFDSRKDGERALKRVTEMGRMHHSGIHAGRITVYRCPHCHCWHHGHNRENMSKRRNPRSVRLQFGMGEA
jgi:hypothetical protein